MSNAPAVLPASLPVRDQFSPVKAGFVLLVHVGALGALWHWSWTALGVCVLLHAVLGGGGICVGYHRLLTHRSFKCPRWLEYTLAVFGSLSMQGGPIDWVAHHRQHHQYPDQLGDPHGADRGFWWSHTFWIFWSAPAEEMRGLARRYVPDLLRQPFYHLLDHVYVPLAILLGILLYVLGGWPFVFWGMFVRLALTYNSTWLVNSAAHAFGYRNYSTPDLSTNCWWVALVAYGEGWHNNHHAYPTSARHGLKKWEVDCSYAFILLLEAVGLAWDLRRASPPGTQMNAAPLA